jgi:hypothetical protein
MALISKTNPPLTSGTKGSTPSWGATKSPFEDTRPATPEPIRAPGVFMRKSATAHPLTQGSSPSARPPMESSRPKVDTVRSVSTVSQPVLHSETAPPFPVSTPAVIGAALPEAAPATAAAPAPADQAATSAGLSASTVDSAPVAATTSQAPFASNGGIPMPAGGPRPASTPMSIPTFVRLFKLGITAVIVLGGSYFTIKQAYPVLMELAHPGSTNAISAKDAPLGLKVIKQTRSVIAKNNANVDHLNQIINDEYQVAPVTLPALPAAPQKLKTPPKAEIAPPVAVIDLKALKNSVNDLTINGVVTGKDPRIIVDGLMVGVGSVVEPKTGLKFVGLDEEKRTVFLAGDNNAIFRKKY